MGSNRISCPVPFVCIFWVHHWLWCDIKKAISAWKMCPPARVRLLLLPASREPKATPFGCGTCGVCLTLSEFGDWNQLLWEAIWNGEYLKKIYNLNSIVNFFLDNFRKHRVKGSNREAITDLTERSTRLKTTTTGMTICLGIGRSTKSHPLGVPPNEPYFFPQGASARNRITLFFILMTFSPPRWACFRCCSRAA